jgi:hypothetical protein
VWLGKLTLRGRLAGNNTKLPYDRINLLPTPQDVLRKVPLDATTDKPVWRSQNEFWAPLVDYHQLGEPGLKHCRTELSEQKFAGVAELIWVGCRRDGFGGVVQGV